MLPIIVGIDTTPLPGCMHQCPIHGEKRFRRAAAAPEDCTGGGAMQVMKRWTRQQSLQRHNYTRCTFPNSWKCSAASYTNSMLYTSAHDTREQSHLLRSPGAPTAMRKQSSPCDQSPNRVVQAIVDTFPAIPW